MAVKNLANFMQISPNSIRYPNYDAYDFESVFLKEKEKLMKVFPFKISKLGYDRYEGFMIKYRFFE